ELHPEPPRALRQPREMLFGPENPPFGGPHRLEEPESLLRGEVGDRDPGCGRVRPAAGGPDEGRVPGRHAPRILSPRAVSCGGLDAEVTYVFRDALLRDAAYELQLP